MSNDNPMITEMQIYKILLKQRKRVEKFDLKNKTKKKTATKKAVFF